MRNIEKIKISTKEDLTYLVDRFTNGPALSNAFTFENDELYNAFFSAIGISVEEFQKRYFYYDKERKIHISESEQGYLWVSTMGLVAKAKVSDNSYVNACDCQKFVLLVLLDAAIELCKNESIYDIDSACNYAIEQLTPALFHNTIFFVETLAKAFLSVNGRRVPHTHEIKSLLKTVKKTMFEKNQNNTLFHAYVIPMLENTVRHIESIPGRFEEKNIKYDDNPQDTTVFLFDFENLNNLRNLVEISHDIVTQMYYESEECFYLRQGLYQRLLQRCETEEEKMRFNENYGFLLERL